MPKFISQADGETGSSGHSDRNRTSQTPEMSIVILNSEMYDDFYSNISGKLIKYFLLHLHILLQLTMQ